MILIKLILQAKCLTEVENIQLCAVKSVKTRIEQINEYIYISNLSI